MALRQLIVAVEGTAAIGPFWQTIVSDYLDKIIRYFCGNESTGQKPSTPEVELSLVMFNTHGSYSGFLVQRSGWTRDMDVFFQWLSAVQFAGGGFDDAAIAEGLAEALMMFYPPNEKKNRNVDGQRHCILVAASKPYPLPTPVRQPQFQNLEQSDNTEAQPDNCLSDAEALAKSFPQRAISLSVICPKNLPKLRDIYNAGKRNTQAADLPVDNIKNPHFLVLISEDFIEAHAALSRTGMFNLLADQNPAKLGMMPVPPISAPPSASLPSANGSVLSRQAMSAGKNSPPATVKVEPTTLTSALGPAFPHMSTVPQASQVVPSLQASSPILTSQDTIPNNEIVQDVKPSMTTSLRPVGGAAAANVRILNDVAQAPQALASGTSIGLPSMGGTHVLSNMISTGTASSVPPAQTVISSVSSGPASVMGSLPILATSQVGSASFMSTASTVTSLGASQSLNNVQVNVSTTIPGMGQGNLSSPPMVQMGVSMNPSMMSGTGTSGMQMRPGMQPVGVNSNSSVTNVPLNEQTPSTTQLAAQSKYVKVWEGNLSGQRRGQPVFITRLEGYRSASASEALAVTWPPTMQIVHMISQDHMNNKQYVGKADFLVFRAMDQHGFLGQLQEKKLCAVIQLPSQTLLLSVSDKAYRLIGMLFPGDMVVFKPQIPNQQLQAQQQQQSQQQLPQLQQQPLAQLPQQQPLMQFQQQLQQLQQQPQQPQQQMVSTSMNQAYMQGAGRSQLLPQVSSQARPTMPGGTYIS